MLRFHFLMFQSHWSCFIFSITELFYRPQDLCTVCLESPTAFAHNWHFLLFQVLVYLPLFSSDHPIHREDASPYPHFAAVCRFAYLFSVLFSGITLKTITMWRHFKFILIWTIQMAGFPGGSLDKESACNAGIPTSVSWLGRSPGEGNGNPLQYSCLGLSRGAWWATVHGVTKSPTQLSD